MDIQESEQVRNKNDNNNSNSNSNNTLHPVCIVNHPSVSQRLNENMNDCQTSETYDSNQSTELGVLANILDTDTMGSISYIIIVRR